MQAAVASSLLDGGASRRHLEALESALLAAARSSGVQAAMAGLLLDGDAPRRHLAASESALLAASHSSGVQAAMVWARCLTVVPLGFAWQR